MTDDGPADLSLVVGLSIHDVKTLRFPAHYIVFNIYEVFKLGQSQLD